MLCIHSFSLCGLQGQPVYDHATAEHILCNLLSSSTRRQPSSDSLADTPAVDAATATAVIDLHELGPRGYFCLQALFVAVNRRQGRLRAANDNRVMIPRSFLRKAPVEAIPRQFRGQAIHGMRIELLMSGGARSRGCVTAYNIRCV